MQRPFHFPRVVIALLLTAIIATASRAAACPFCDSASQTWTEEIDAMDVVVIVEFDRLAAPAQADPQSGPAPLPSATFAITRVLKGEAALAGRRTLTTVFVGEPKRGEKFVVMGVGPPDVSWSTPLPVNERQYQYLLELMRVPREGAARLVFFLPYLEDPDSMLSGDAYDEFARASYDIVKQLKPHLNREQLVTWIRDPDVPVSRRRLYFTLLGVCGDQRDLPMLEQRLRSRDAQSRSGLDALIACYLTLRGPEGVPLIEDLFLRPRDAESADDYADVYAAIVALRFHGLDGDVIPRARLLQAFTLVLDRPAMADLVIPDFARWEDWSQLDRLVELFKTADTKVTYVRLPIINYVRACPLPEAKAALQQLEQIDPEAVKRSLVFFPNATNNGK